MYEKLSLLQNILELLQDSIREVYKNEHDYFKIANGQHRHERQIVFRIAHILANKIEEAKKLIGEEGKIFVDFEPNRFGNKVKRTPDGKTIIPDVIIHERKGNGYFVVEFKHEGLDEKHDFKKLKQLTTPKEEREEDWKKYPFYKLGIFVRLKDSDTEYTLFKNGEVILPQERKIYEKYTYEDILTN